MTFKICLVVVTLVALVHHSSSQSQPVCEKPLDLVFVLDGSNSVGFPSWLVMIQTVQNVTQSLPVTDNLTQVGLVVFSDLVTYKLPLTGNKTLIMTELPLIEFPDSSTATDLAISAAVGLLNVSRTDVNDAIVIITDGEANDQLEAIRQAKTAQDRGISIFALGVGELISMTSLQKLTSENMVLCIANFTGLLQALQKLTQQACTEVPDKTTTTTTISSSTTTALTTPTNPSIPTASNVSTTTTGKLNATVPEAVTTPSTIISTTTINATATVINATTTTINATTTTINATTTVINATTTTINATTTTRNPPANETTSNTTLIYTTTTLPSNTTTIGTTATVSPYISNDNICASVRMKDGVGYRYHPTDCDKFIQCYFGSNDTVVAVYRRCPMGKYWDQSKLQCDEACNVDCPEEKCQKDDLQTYKMEGSCRAYWRCDNFKSRPECCPVRHAYIAGVGCVWDPTCVHPCGQEACDDIKGPCVVESGKQSTIMFNRGQVSRRSNVLSPPSWKTLNMVKSDLWRPDIGWPRSYCGNQVDLLSCRCVIPNTENSCLPAVNLQFSNTTLLNFVSTDLFNLRDVTLTDGVARFPGTSGSLLHVTLKERGERPVAISLTYREATSFKTPVYLLRSSGCEADGSISVVLEDGFITARVASRFGEFAATAISTLGIPASQWKTLTLVYDSTSLTLLVKSMGLHQVSRIDVPRIPCWTCGLDFAPGSMEESFSGDMQYIQLYYCYPSDIMV